MFLDPDPKRERNSGSGFFSSQRPVASPRDHSATWRRKNSPLAERTQSENNQQTLQQAQQLSITKPTVRIVRTSPDISTGAENESYSSRGAENRKADAVQHLPSLPAHLIHPRVIKPGSAKSTPSGPRYDVSDARASTNEAPLRLRVLRDNLLTSSIPNHHAKAEWHRRSGSSGNFSTSSTLPDADSVYGLAKSLWSDSRTSQSTTLGGTPTPSEWENRDISGVEEDVSEISLPTLLQPLEETSPDVSTVRLVSSPQHDHTRQSRSPSDSSGTSIARPFTLSHSTSASSSTASLIAGTNIVIFPSPPAPRHQQSNESLVDYESPEPLSSSPNVVAFASDSPRPRSLSHPLRSFTSFESIQSRLEPYPTIRPSTARSAATDTSWASRPASLDEIPALFIPKKRLRHKAASASLSTIAAEAAPPPSEPTMASEEYDTLPYPRQAFSTHLSTIASESEAHSRSPSQQLSHFSIGSGVSTIGEWSNARTSDNWGNRVVSAIEPDVQPEEPSPYEPGDMTMDLYREESARPQPLFHDRPPSAPLTPERNDAPLPPAQYRYNGPLPPLPPIPKGRDSEEHFDTVPELAPPQLREQRSGYSLRRRSHSTPSRGHSRQYSRASEDSRWSQGTTIFPTWAKAYYGYGATLLSSSQISLSLPLDTQPQISRYLITREWSRSHGASTISSNYSDLGSSSAGGGGGGGSGHFLPAIFRPRIKKIKTGITPKSRKSRPSPRESESRPDSMIIARNPLPPPPQEQDPEPPSSPRFGSLHDHSDPRRPLPRRYTKQKNWDKMDFPRPMSNDLLRTDYALPGLMSPRLAPSKRLGGPRASAWHAPSFAESLDTLFRSRCNRQILLFVLGFLFPPAWWLASCLPLPRRPLSVEDFEKARGPASAEDLQTAMMRHEAGDAERRWTEERTWMKARWWRWLNRVMSVVGVLILGAVIALAVVATRT